MTQFQKVINAFPALRNSKVTVELDHFIKSPKDQKYPLCSDEYKMKA